MCGGELICQGCVIVCVLFYRPPQWLLIADVKSPARFTAGLIGGT